VAILFGQWGQTDYQAVELMEELAYPSLI